MSMTLSPMQQNHVTKQEFNEFKLDTEIRFDNVEKSIKDLKNYTNQGFQKMEEYIDNSFVEFGKQIDLKLEKNRDEIILALKNNK